jgi:hypothetical protein
MNKNIKIIRKIYGYTLSWLWHFSRYEWLRTAVPVETLVVPVSRTRREIYELERANYRLTHALIRRGDLMDKRSYFLYSLTAKKYGWFYIKETYDNS